MLGLASIVGWGLNFAVATSALAPGAPYSGHIIIQADLSSIKDQTQAKELGGRSLAEGDQLGPQLILLSPQDQARWHLSGRAFRVINPDVEAAIEAERLRLSRRSFHADFFADFQDAKAIGEHLDKLTASAPTRVIQHTLGHSLEKREIRALEIRGKGREKPAILVNGTIHAREWLSPMTMLYFAQRLVDDYPSDARVKLILDRTRVFIVPVLNIDGYEYTWTNDRYWRKNRREGGGVDLNRNWGGFWMPDNDMSSETYPGTAAFSEPETQAWRDFAKNLKKVVAFTDWHTPLEQVMCPYFGSDEPASHAQEHTKWGNAAAAAISQKHGKEYGACGTYAKSRVKGGGVSIDWFITEENDGLGAMGWLVEMRGPDFVVDPSEILPTAEENYEGFLALMTEVAQTFGDDSEDPSDTGSSSDEESSTSNGEGSESTEDATSSEKENTGSDEGDETSTSSQGDTSGSTSGDPHDSSSEEQDSDDDDDDDDDDGEDDETSENEQSGGEGCRAAPESGWTGLLVGFAAFLGRRKKHSRLQGTTPSHL